MQSSKYPIPPALSIVWYDTPEAVYAKMWEPAAIEAGITVAELLAESETMAMSSNGDEVRVTDQDTYAGMREMGCWGWVDTDENVIHAWAAKDADPEHVVHFLAHEVGHVTDKPDPDDFQEEMRAEQYGHVARLAFKLFSERPQC